MNSANEVTAGAGAPDSRPLLIIGRLPASPETALQGQHRVSYSFAKHLPVPNRLVTVLKTRNLLARLFDWRPRAKSIHGTAFTEWSVLGLFVQILRSQRVFVVAGYYYGLLCCLAKLVKGRRLFWIHRTGGFVRREWTISRKLREVLVGRLPHVALEALVLRVADRVIVNSDMLREALTDIYPFTRDKTAVIPNGLDDNLDPGLASATAPSPTPIELLCVANLFGKKGIDILLEAFKRASFACPVRLTLVGDGIRPIQERVRRSREELDLTQGQKSLRWLCHLRDHDLKQLYQSAHGYVQLSRFDEGPSAVVEAYAYGLPLLLSDGVGAHPVILRSSRCERCPAELEPAVDALQSFVAGLPAPERQPRRLDVLRWETILDDCWLRAVLS